MGIDDLQREERCGGRGHESCGVRPRISPRRGGHPGERDCNRAGVRLQDSVRAWRAFAREEDVIAFPRRADERHPVEEVMH